MWDPVRQNWIAEHRFYVEQARKRLLSQFANIGEEADRAADEHIERQSFNPDVDDPSDFHERAYEKSIEFYQLLSELQEQTRLSVIAGMYHMWDKKLREWMAREVKHWHVGDKLPRAIWEAQLSEVLELLSAFGFDVKALAVYKKIDSMRLVVNVFKHGDGTSLDELKATYPEFLPDPLGRGDLRRVDHLDHTSMKVSDEDLEAFSEAIVDFWRIVPGEICVNEAATVEVPKRFENAFKKDEAIAKRG